MQHLKNLQARMETNVAYPINSHTNCCTHPRHTPLLAQSYALCASENLKTNGTSWSANTKTEQKLFSALKQNLMKLSNIFHLDLCILTSI